MPEIFCLCDNNVQDIFYLWCTLYRELFCHWAILLMRCTLYRIYSIYLRQIGSGSHELRSDIQKKIEIEMNSLGNILY